VGRSARETCRRRDQAREQEKALGVAHCQ
jgi:hypothetical protein